jgi:hypothetical protein
MNVRRAADGGDGSSDAAAGSTGLAPLAGRNRDRLRPAVVGHAVWKAAISTAADLRATLAAGATGAS